MYDRRRRERLAGCSLLLVCTTAIETNYAFLQPSKPCFRERRRIRSSPSSSLELSLRQERTIPSSRLFAIGELQPWADPILDSVNSSSSQNDSDGREQPSNPLTSSAMNVTIAEAAMGELPFFLTLDGDDEYTSDDYLTDSENNWQSDDSTTILRNGRKDERESSADTSTTPLCDDNSADALITDSPLNSPAQLSDTTTNITNGEDILLLDKQKNSTSLLIETVMKSRANDTSSSPNEEEQRPSGWLQTLWNKQPFVRSRLPEPPQEPEPARTLHKQPSIQLEEEKEMQQPERGIFRSVWNMLPFVRTTADKLPEEKPQRTPIESQRPEEELGFLRTMWNKLPFAQAAPDPEQQQQPIIADTQQLLQAKPSSTLRSMWSRHTAMWKHRHARTAEEGIRREKTSQLSTVLASIAENDSRRQRVARFITGLIHALAEEADGLLVQVSSRPDTPLWDKQVNAIRVQFSRLGFKSLRIGGQEQQVSDQLETALLGKHPLLNARVNAGAVKGSDDNSDDNSDDSSSTSKQLNADEAFNRIDVDKSGALDSDELAQALNSAALSPEGVDCEKNTALIKDLATDLVKLYDFNGDGVVDRSEYQSMVEDMATLREAQNKKLVENNSGDGETSGEEQGWLSGAKQLAYGFVGLAQRGRNMVIEAKTNIEKDKTTTVVTSNMTKALGSITVSDLKLDLRRLLFGAIPLVKHITPGGPLILEPFTVTVNGSFNRGDIMESDLLDAGLRQLVARTLRRRVGSMRDFLEGALFYGRSWKLISGTGPVVQVPKLTNVEMDKRNRLIITGRARVQSRPGGPVIENAFKVRTKIGTRNGGRVIRLVEPELALVLECPNALEEK